MQLSRRCEGGALCGRDLRPKPLVRGVPRVHRQRSVAAGPSGRSGRSRGRSPAPARRPLRSRHRSAGTGTRQRRGWPARRASGSPRRRPASALQCRDRRCSTCWMLWRRSPKWARCTVRAPSTMRARPTRRCAWIEVRSHLERSSAVVVGASAWRGVSVLSAALGRTSEDCLGWDFHRWDRDREDRDLRNRDRPHGHRGTGTMRRRRR